MKRGLSKFQLAILLSIIFIISVGFIIGGSAQSPEMNPLYRCFDGKDHMLSNDKNCEIMGASAREGDSPLGYAYAEERPGTIPLYRCLTRSGDHFETKESNCETDRLGNGVEAEQEEEFRLREENKDLLGYILINDEDGVVALHRFYFSVPNDHVTTNDIDEFSEIGGISNAGYEEILGYILKDLPTRETEEQQTGLCNLQVTDECQEEVPGKVAGDGNDVIISCPSIDGFQYAATGIKIIDFNNIWTMRPDKYKIRCCKLACA